jgi:hypothetical protein
MDSSIDKRDQLFIEDLHESFTKDLGKDHFEWRSSRKHFIVWPTWIFGAGGGYMQSMKSCVDLTLALIKKYNENYKYRIEQSMVGGTTLFGFYDDSITPNNQNFICLVSCSL